MTLIILCAASAVFGALIVISALWAQKLSEIVSQQWWERRNSEWPDQPFASGHARRDRSDGTPKEQANPQPVPSTPSGHPTGIPSKSGDPLAVNLAKHLEIGESLRRIL